ncbi:MAG TPA: ABC-2 family transporter protein [Blastocatellia bacterium]|nr:ABC-2 family transporter protein [Blastocatellia bacterium]
MAVAADRISIPNAPSRLSIYIEFGRIAFLKILAYRLRYYTGIVTYFVNVTVYYFIWKAIYTSNTSIQGFDLTQMITYVSVGWIARSFYFNNIDRDLAAQVTEGRLASDLIRPVNLQMMYISQAAGESVFRLVMFTAPTALVILLVFPVSPPAGVVQCLLFLLSLVFSFLVFALINFIIGLFAIRLKSILGLIRAKHIVIELLSGLLIPLSFFPNSFQRVFDFLPFKQITYTPLILYLGKAVGHDALKVLAIQVIWVVILAVVGHLFWRWNESKITIHGG